MTTKPTKGKSADPAFRRERASKAGTVSQSTDKIIDRIIRRAGELTPEQLERLAALLPPIPER